MGDDSNNRWWHTLAFTAAASAGTFIASHWGGVTHDDLSGQLRQQKAEIIEEVSKKVNTLDGQRAKDVDDLRRYIDAKTTPAVVPKKRRKTRSDDE